MNYNPDGWDYVESLGAEAYERENPALVALNDIYNNSQAAVSWLQIQVSAFFMTSPETIAEYGKGIIERFSRNFYQSIKRYKLLDIMIFFSRLTAGCYRQYGAFDTTQIATAFHERFLRERAEEMEAYKQKQETEVREALHKPNPNYLTRDEYLELRIWEDAGYSISDMRQFRNRIRSWVQRARNGFYSTTI